MSKDRKRLMLEQFQGAPEEWIENLLGPLNDLIENTNRIDSKGLSFEKSLGVEYKEIVVDVPSDWLEIGTDGAPAFMNGWRNFVSVWEPLAIRKSVDGVVHMKGLISSGTVSTAGTGIVFMLPDKYRPASSSGLHFATASNGLFGLFKIQMDPSTPSRYGSLEATVGSNVYMSMRAQWEAEDRSPIIPSCYPILFKTSMPKVGLVMISQVLDSSNNPVYTGPLSVDWVQVGDGRVSIRNIPGLRPATSYKITFAVFPR